LGGRSYPWGMDETLVLPDDLAACHALLVEQARAILEQREKLEAQHRTIESQQLTINELFERAFFHRRERYLDDPNQLKLDFGDTPEAADAAAGLAEAIEEAELLVAEHKRRKRRPRKRRNEQLPEHLPRYEVEAPVPEDLKHCATHGQRTFIGYDRVETLEFEPPQLKVRVTLYAKFICKDEPACGVREPPREPGLVEGNRYGTSVAAEVVTGKCGYHLPIYREQDYFAGSGWTVDRSTLLNIFRAAAEVVHPFAWHLRGEVLGSGAIGTDDTRVTLLLPQEIPAVCQDDPKSRRIHEVFTEARAEGRKSVSGRMWAYRSLTVPINVFDFTVSRHRDGPDEFLVAGGFVGKLLADCYSGYQGITLRSDARIVRAACNAHARRKLFDTRESYPLLSSPFLAMYQQLYDVEERAKFGTVGEREELRDREARPVWQRMRELLDSKAASEVLPKEKFAEALGYLRNQWEALQVYLGDGRLPIDNNETEQLMKHVAIGRKNWLFVGSVAAGERMADLLTVVSSALRNDLDVRAYVKDVLDRLLAGSTDYASLRPDHWAAAHPEHIRVYRADERRDRAAAQHDRRARRRAAKRNVS
jgi:transposase